MRLASWSKSFSSKPNRVISLTPMRSAPEAVKPSSSGGGLIVDDDVVLLQALGNLGAPAVAHGHDDLVGLGVVDGGVAHHVQTVALQGSGRRTWRCG